MFGYGVFRHTTAGGIENIFADTVSADDLLSIRYEFASARLPNGKTRLYVGAGYNEADPTFGASRLYRDRRRAQSAAVLTTGGPNGGWTSLSSDDPTQRRASARSTSARRSAPTTCSSPHPPGGPNEVVLGGSMQYTELPLYAGPDISNGRAVVMSTDCGRELHRPDGRRDAAAGRPALQLRGHAPRPARDRVRSGRTRTSCSSAPTAA